MSVETAAVRPVSDTRPDYSLKKIESVDAAQVVVDSLVDILLLLRPQYHGSLIGPILSDDNSLQLLVCAS